MNQPVPRRSEKNEYRFPKILENCHRANPWASVLIVEMDLAPGHTPRPGKVLDLVVLFCAGGLMPQVTRTAIPNSPRY